MSNADEQAFPIPADEDHVRSRGLTKREYFAAMAMQGLCSLPAGEKWPSTLIATYAVEQADALLAELAKQS